MKKLVFHHIPKTGGTTVISLLDRHYGLDQIKPVDFFGKPERNVTLQDVQSKYNIISQYKLVHGHCPVPLYNNLEVDYRFTILRRPLSRILSLYNDWTCKSSESLRNADVEDKYIYQAVRDNDLAELINLGQQEILKLFDNGQARLLSGSMDKPSLDMSDVNKAILSLEAMNLVGITEMMMSTMKCFHQDMNWAFNPQFQAENIGRYRQNFQVENNPSELWPFIKWDIILYNKALSLLDKRLATRESETPQALKSIPRISSMHIIDMTMGFEGTGWHVREGLAGPNVWRWTGPGNESNLKINLNSQLDFKLRIGVISVIQQTILNEANIYLNGHALSWKHLGTEDGKQVIEAFIPRKLIHDSRDILTIQVSKVIAHSDIDSTIGDQRKKGLAITFFSFEPVDHKK